MKAKTNVKTEFAGTVRARARRSSSKRRGNLWAPAMALALLLSLFLTLNGTAQVGAAGPVAPTQTAGPVAFTQATTRTITYTYDEAGRLTGVDYGGGTTIVYTYDAAGNLVAGAVSSGGYRVYLPLVLRNHGH